MFIVPRTELIQKGFDEYEQQAEKPTFPVVDSKAFSTRFDFIFGKYLFIYNWFSAAEKAKEDESEQIAKASVIVAQRLAALNKRKAELQDHLTHIRKQIKEYKVQQQAAGRQNHSSAAVTGGKDLSKLQLDAAVVEPVEDDAPSQV